MAQLLDSGIVSICNLVNKAEVGDMPKYELEEKFKQYFGERSIGLTRSYLAKGADEQVDMVIRIWNEGNRPKIGQYAVLTAYEYQEGKKGDQYCITLVQPTTDDDGLKVFDLTLQRLEENYNADIE